MFLILEHLPYDIISLSDTQTLGDFTLESNALNYHYLPKMCIELALALLDLYK